MGRPWKQSLGDWMIENLGKDSIEKYWSDKNDFSPFETGTKSHKTAYIKCTNTVYHEDYKVIICDFTLKNHRCPYCSGRRTHPDDSFARWLIDNYGENALKEMWSDKNIEDPWSLSLSSNKKI